jgi:hypothetical protein
MTLVSLNVTNVSKESATFIFRAEGIGNRFLRNVDHSLPESTVSCQKTVTLPHGNIKSHNIKMDLENTRLESEDWICLVEANILHPLE